MALNSKEYMSKEISQIQAVYLAGTSYCGSTLLAFLLNSHPQVVSVGEASLNRRVQKKQKINYVCSCGSLLVNCTFWTEIFRLVEERGLQFGAYNWTNDYKYKNALLHKFFSTYPSQRLLRALQKIALCRLPFHKNRVAYANKVNIAFIQSALQLTGTEVFFDTSKALMRLSYLHAMPALDLKVVRVVRDVRAFANSYKSRGVAVEQAARHWRNYQLSADDFLQTLPSDRVMVMRYEDFCHAPLHWLRRLHTFFGVQPLEPPETITSGEHHIIGNHMRLQKITAITTNDSWREKLTAAETTRILRIAGVINERLGYLPHGLEQIPVPQGVTDTLEERTSSPVSG